MNSQKEVFIPLSKAGKVFGALDENLHKIETAFGVVITMRGENGVINGNEKDSERAADVLNKLLELEEITPQKINYLIESQGEARLEDLQKIDADVICLTASGRPIKPKTLGQKEYLDKIRENTIVFALGPAGTGKTYLAMAMAVTALRKRQVSRIILTRPAIEAGERLGFLPGDMQAKVDPYLRPLYDALFDLMGAENFQKHVERNVIEVAPLAYMRGRTLENSFIVLDEAQNTTPEQMKMFLTRIGFGSKAVATGDITQADLPLDKRNGLADAAEILSEVEGIGVCRLTLKDVARHPLVQKIIRAYEKRETKTFYENKTKNKINKINKIKKERRA